MFFLFTFPYPYPYSPSRTTVHFVQFCTYLELQDAYLMLQWLHIPMHRLYLLALGFDQHIDKQYPPSHVAQLSSASNAKIIIKKYCTRIYILLICSTATAVRNG